MPETESVQWSPSVRVLKYSPDQVRWARNHLLRLRLTGDDLAHMFPDGPEEGCSHSEGNSLTVAGQLNIARLITGDPEGLPLLPTAAGKGHTLIGVGSEPTPNPTSAPLAAATLSPVRGETLDGTCYQEMDPGYPVVLSPNMLSGQATFNEGLANFGWEEWCWAVCRETSMVCSEFLQEVAPEGVMVSRKAVSHGVKRPERSWVFQCTVRLL